MAEFACLGCGGELTDKPDYLAYSECLRCGLEGPDDVLEALAARLAYIRPLTSRPKSSGDPLDEDMFDAMELQELRALEARLAPAGVLAELPAVTRVKRIADNDLNGALEALQRHVQSLGPAGAFDVVVTMRVDGRASLDWIDSHGRPIARARQFHTVQTRVGDEWVEYFPGSLKEDV